MRSAELPPPAATIGDASCPDPRGTEIGEVIRRGECDRLPIGREGERRLRDLTIVREPLDPTARQVEEIEVAVIVRLGDRSLVSIGRTREGSPLPEAV